MNLNLIPACLLFVLLLGSIACSPAGSSAKSVEVSCDDFSASKNISKQLEIASGDTFTVVLCSNATTGFNWSESAQISDSSIVEQTSHKYNAPASETPPLAGAPGQEVWTFKALKAGTSTISMEYGRPWEGGEKGEWVFALTIVVK